MNYPQAFKNSWRDMIARCNNPNNPSWKYYGERGVTVASEWETLEGFAADMLLSYFEGATIDRRDPNKSYCKENCQWILLCDQTSVGRLSRRYNNRTGITGVERLTATCWRVIVRERGAARGKGKKYSLYRGPDFFEACCARKAWEAIESKIPASTLKSR